MKLPTVSLKSLLVSLFLFVLLFAWSTQSVFAARNVDSATLNGTSSVTVAPSASITASVTVTTSGGANDWQSTTWQVSGQSVNCVDHTDYTTSGTYTENFTVTAPGSTGSYDVSFIAYGNNGCSTGASNTYTLTNGITVSSPTATPTPVPTATLTPTPPPGATDTPTPPPGATNTPTPPPGSTATPTPPPGSTATPTTTPSASGEQAVTYYPSVNLNVYSPDPTNNQSLSFSGSATIDQGSIRRVEYSITEGAEWLNAQLNGGSFSFTTPPLAEGAHAILVRAQSAADIYTRSDSYASDMVTVITTPPQIAFNEFEQNPTNDTTPAITGILIPAAGAVTRVEVTLDEGVTWLPASFSDRTFSFTPEPLEDNNYNISARVFDNAGNVGNSENQTLIIDTLPPLIGGGIYSLGPQPLLPLSDGSISIVAGAQTSVVMSMKGGVTEAEIMTGDGSFPLVIQPGTNRWVGTVAFTTAGDKQLIISAVDGAGNETTRPFSTIHVEPFGTIRDTKTNTLVPDASVTLYVRETTTRQWVVWDGTSYGQQNPKQTTDEGAYSFLVPAGTYYLDVTAAGYHPVQSEELTVLAASIVNGTLPVRPAPALRFTVPVFGPVVLSMPSFLLPPDTVSSEIFGANKTPPMKSANTTVNKAVPAFSLPDLSGNTISPDRFSGKRWVLSFFAPWSPLSQEQAPLLSKLSPQLPDDQEMLAVSLQETVAATRTFLKKGNYDFPVVADTNGETAALMNVSVLPYHVFIDSHGIIRETYTGVLTDEVLLDKLFRLP